MLFGTDVDVLIPGKYQVMVKIQTSKIWLIIVF